MTTKITLEAWAAKYWDPAPSIHTLRLWTRNGRIFPWPEKAGRTYYVDPNARYLEKDDPMMGIAARGSKTA
jgi:hypothetical protein